MKSVLGTILAGALAGTIASAFLLPPQIVCRTLVNSHLTLLAGYGIFAGVLWFGFLFYALLNGFYHRAAHISLIGLAISAFSSSIFDDGILFDFRDAGGLSRLNQCLAWGLLFFYLGLIVFLSIGRFNFKRVAIAMSAAILLPMALLLFRSENTPKVINGEFLSLPGTSATLVLYDNTFSLRECAELLRDGGILPIHSAELRSDTPFPKSNKVILFGNCAYFATRYHKASITLVMPPPHFVLTDNVQRLLLKRYGNNDLLEEQAKARNIPYDFYP